jgi:hypothetical protein
MLRLLRPAGCHKGALHFACHKQACAWSAGFGRLSLGGAAEGAGKKLIRKKQKSFDPYSNFEANEIRRGKHSNVMHKMGNRSMNFN